MSEKQSTKSGRGGKRPGAGRPAGVPNKLSSTVKDNVIAVFDRLGGAEHMVQWASDNPTQFYNIYAKLLPLQVNGSGENGEFEHSLKVTLVKANDRAS